MSGRYLVVALFLVACGSSDYDDGWNDGCYDAGLEGERWGSINGAECAYDPDPGEPTDMSDDYDLGWNDGWDSCFVDAYNEAYEEAARIAGCD